MPRLASLAACLLLLATPLSADSQADNIAAMRTLYRTGTEQVFCAELAMYANIGGSFRMHEAGVANMRIALTALVNGEVSADQLGLTIVPSDPFTVDFLLGKIIGLSSGLAMAVIVAPPPTKSEQERARTAYDNRACQLHR